MRLIDGPLAGAMCPVFQTSANRSGEPAPSRLADVDETILAGADLVIDGGDLPGAPSTVVDVTGVEAGREWSILRQGGLAGRGGRRASLRAWLGADEPGDEHLTGGFEIGGGRALHPLERHSLDGARAGASSSPGPRLR